MNVTYVSLRDWTATRKPCDLPIYVSYPQGCLLVRSKKNRKKKERIFGNLGSSRRVVDGWSLSLEYDLHLRKPGCCLTDGTFVRPETLTIRVCRGWTVSSYLPATRPWRVHMKGWLYNTSYAHMLPRQTQHSSVLATVLANTVCLTFTKGGFLCSLLLGGSKW